MIVVQKVDKAFDHICALHQVSIQIAEREIYGLVGPDGAGKTTLLRIICGLMKPDRGLVEIAGLSPSRQSIVRKSGNRFCAKNDATPKI